MRTIIGLFGKSPFSLLQKHMENVKECVDGVIPLMEAFIKGDREAVEKEAKRVKKLEHKADIIKDKIRGQLPRGLFMPVNRADLLSVLSAQDDICDSAEDIGVLLTLREMKVPKELKAVLKVFVSSIMKVCNQAYTIMEELDDLVESSFSGLEANKVLKMIDELGHMEYEADKKQMEIAKKIFSIEDKLKPVDIFMWIKILEKLGNLANDSERMGNRLRLMLSKG